MTKPRKQYPLIPKFFQPKVQPDVATTVKIFHWDYVDQISKGSVDESCMWGWIEAGLACSEMLRLLTLDGLKFTEEAKAKIKEQLAIQVSVRARHKRTGAVGFSALELVAARAAALVMDDLIAMDRHGIAWAAREWSKLQIEKLKRS